MHIQHITHSHTCTHTLTHTCTLAHIFEQLALDVTRGISASANAAVHLSMLEGQDKLDLGPLVLQDTFGVQEGPKPFKERRAFLFKKGLIITRRKRDSSEKESYVVKDQLMVRPPSRRSPPPPPLRHWVWLLGLTSSILTIHVWAQSFTLPTSSHVHTHVHTHVHMHVHTRTHACTYACTHTYTRMYTHVHTHVHTLHTNMYKR